MKNILLAQATVEPTFQPINLPINPNAGLSGLFSFGMQIFLVICGIAVVIYALWGAFDWIISGGEKEKVEAAKRKIISAFVGIILVVILIAVWSFVVGDILHIFKTGNGTFSIPALPKL